MEPMGIERHRLIEDQPARAKLMGSRFVKPCPKTAHFCSMCGPHFCSMKITEDVRRYAQEQGIAEGDALQAGMEQKARDFADAGAEVYTTA